MPNILPLKSALSNCSFPGVYGGYLAAKSPAKLRFKTAFLWLKASNENFPWYDPMPLSPTPPNGKPGSVTCNDNFVIMNRVSLKSYSSFHSFGKGSVVNVGIKEVCVRKDWKAS